MMALILSEADFQAILDAGNWSESAEDHENYCGEQLPVELVERWVQDYDPQKMEASAGLAILTLTTAAAA